MRAEDGRRMETGVGTKKDFSSSTASLFKVKET